MKTSTKFALTVLAAAVVAAVTSPDGPLNVWPEEPAHADAPPGGFLFVLLVASNVFEMLVFGVGVAFVVFVAPRLRHAPLASASPALRTAAVVAVSWFLLSWYPHDVLHRVLGDGWGALVFIQYAFHLTLAGGALVLAAFLAALTQPVEAADQRPTRGRP